MNHLEISYMHTSTHARIPAHNTHTHICTHDSDWIVAVHFYVVVGRITI